MEILNKVHKGLRPCIGSNPTKQCKRRAHRGQVNK